MIKETNINRIVFYIFIFLSVSLLIYSPFNIIFWILGFLLTKLLNNELAKSKFKTIYRFIFVITILICAFDFIISSPYFYTILSSNIINSREELLYALEVMFVYNIPQPLRLFSELLSLVALLLKLFFPAFGAGFIVGAFLNYEQNKERAKKEALS